MRRTCRRWALGLLLCATLRADWEMLGPFGGSAAIVVADPHSVRTFLAATRGGLLFRTRNSGESWTPLLFPLQLDVTLNALVVDPQTPGVYLAGITGEMPRDSGMLRSSDFGATWREVPDLRGLPVRAIAFMRANSSMVAAATDSGVFLSRDGGRSWGRASPDDNRQLRPVMSVSFDSRNSWILYAGTPHLPWKTLDGAATWHSIATGMIDDSDIFSIAVDRNRPLQVFAGACSGIYRTLDGGASWKRLTEAKDSSYRTYVVVQDPQYQDVWFAGTSRGIVRSDNNGIAWRTLAPFTTRSIAFDPGKLGRILIATDDGGILRSEDNGSSWEPANRGFCNRRLSSLWKAAGMIYVTGAEGPAPQTYRYDPHSGAWDQADAEDSARLAPVDPPEPVRPPPGEFENDTIQSMCRNPRTGVLFAARYGVIYASADSGRLWKRVSPSSWPVTSVRQLAFLPDSPDRLLVLTAQQGLWELRLE